MTGTLDILYGIKEAHYVDGNHKEWARIHEMLCEMNPFPGRNHKNHYALVADSLYTQWPSGCNCEFCEIIKDKFIRGTR